MVCTKDKEDGGELWLCSEWPKVDMMVLSSMWQWQLFRFHAYSMAGL